VIKLTAILIEFVHKANQSLNYKIMLNFFYTELSTSYLKTTSAKMVNKKSIRNLTSLSIETAQHPNILGFQFTIPAAITKCF